eukprot:TRINITY_DN52599_c0_g1_i1.p1 TRINITY_DN52599_c0_g1~~TRINITY_DN52599_c0_g1_i1.p1  ORF type:complete len:635 (-),score=184.90 TRINITY_DN52599_c0_g1_i1:331-2235(-)
MLSRRQVMNMKWRTAFVAVTICGLFYFGPSLRSSQSNRVGRTLLEAEPEPEPKVDGGEEGVARPDCEAGKDDWKRAVKFFYKAVEKPDADENVIECAKLTTVATRECKVSDCVCPRLRPNCIMVPHCQFLAKVSADPCKTATLECIGQWENGTERIFIPLTDKDPMFPNDLFTEEQRGNGAIVLHIIGILYMFYALALVCDHYFVPSLDVIIEKFGISPDVAGATFMAAGGSAPELFTSVIGVFIAVSDVGIGTIVGSAVFNVLFVIAACAFASATALKLTAWPLIRDTTFYSIALMVLVIFFNDDYIQWWEALILFLWYFTYVTFMKFNAPLEAKFLETFPGLKKPVEEGGDQSFHAGFKYHPRRKPLLALMRGKVETQPEDQELKPGVGLGGLKVQLQGEDGEKENLNPPKDEEKPQDEEKGKEDEEEYKDYIRSGPEGGILSKIMWVVSLPLMVPMWITIPDPQDEKRKKYFPIAFIVSILWIAVFSYFMVWWATVTGECLGISDAVMGLTFLAAGTSVPDLITSVLVAKEGKGDMAVSSSIGSNLFDVTVGLPLPWLLYTIINGKAMEVNSVGMGCSIGMLFIMLLLVFISIIVFKWEMTKPMGGVMICLYVVFVVVSLGLSECWFPCPF